jgi:multiple sugar transport system permease protein
MKTHGKSEIAALYILIFICLITTLLPFIWMLSTSLKQSGEIYTKTPVFIPKQPTLDHYKELFYKVNFMGHFINSLIVALGLTFFSVIINALAGYAFAKQSFPGKENLFTLLLLTMMIPGQVTMMPVFLILRSLGFLNSYWGLIIPGSASVFAIFMLKQFMSEIPDELLDAARIDGAGELRIFWSIVLPLCKPVIATLIIFNFMGSWNEFLWPLIIMLKEEMYTLPVALANLNGQHNTEWGLLMAGSVVVVVPVIFLFLSVQKYYIKGISAGAIKG